MNISFEQLMTFRVVATARSFSEAADILFVSQPAVSHRIGHLERQLHARLFERGGRGKSVQLTAAGQALLRLADEGAELLDRMNAEVAVYRDKADVEEITIILNTSIADHWYAERIGPFFDRHPTVQVRVIHGTADAIHAAVVDGSADLGFGVPPFADDIPVRFVPLFYYSTVLACAPSRVADFQRILDSRQEPLPFVSSTAEHWVQHHQRWAQAAGITLRIVLAADDAHLRLHSVFHGHGTGIFQELMVRTELRSGRLVALKTPTLNGTHPFGVLVHRTRKLSPAARRLMKEMTALPRTPDLSETL